MTLAVLELDPARSSLGLPLDWRVEIGGRLALGSTLEALGRSREVKSAVIALPEASADRVEEIASTLDTRHEAGTLPVEVLSLSTARTPRQQSCGTSWNNRSC